MLVGCIGYLTTLQNDSSCFGKALLESVEKEVKLIFVVTEAKFPELVKKMTISLKVVLR